MIRYLYIFLFLIVSTVNVHAVNMIMSTKIVGNKLIIGFSKSISKKDIRQFTLKGKTSTRYVFDFKNTIPRDAWMIKKVSHEAIKSFRMSRFSKSTTRVVVEANRPYNMSCKTTSQKTYRITLPKATTKAGRVVIAKSTSAPVTSHAKKEKKNPIDLFVSLFKDKKTKVKSEETVSAGLTATEGKKRPKKRYIVVIDPGHGGKDSGAMGLNSRKYMEKTVVLMIAKRLRVHLETLGFKVYMTRSSNRFVKLGSRTRFANRKKADAFVSIHANAVPKRKWNTRQGIETYFLQTSRSARSKRIAASENSVVLEKKDRISKNVILNLMTGPKIVMSNKMAIDVQKNILKNVHTRYPAARDNGVRPAPFWVLVGAQMPSILVETGYITHPEERKRLFSKTYQDLIAKGIAQGISTYFANREREME